ncbi:MAG: IS3 family transposase [Acidobacteriota bacterium]
MPLAASSRRRRSLKTSAHRHPCYGHRRMTVLLRRQGHPINAKRVHRPDQMAASLCMPIICLLISPTRSRG